MTEMLPGLLSTNVLSDLQKVADLDRTYLGYDPNKNRAAKELLLTTKREYIDKTVENIQEKAGFPTATLTHWRTKGGLDVVIGMFEGEPSFMPSIEASGMRYGKAGMNFIVTDGRFESRRGKWNQEEDEGPFRPKYQILDPYESFELPSGVRISGFEVDLDSGPAALMKTKGGISFDAEHGYAIHMHYTVSVGIQGNDLVVKDLVLEVEREKPEHSTEKYTFHFSNSFAFVASGEIIADFGGGPVPFRISVDGAYDRNIPFLPVGRQIDFSRTLDKLLRAIRNDEIKSLEPYVVAFR